MSASLILAFFLSFAFANESQPFLTLDEALQESLHQSPDIQKLEAHRSAVAWKHFEALGTGFLPKLSLDAHHFFDEKYSYTTINFGGSPTPFAGFYPANEATLKASIPIFDGFSSMKMLSASALEKEAATAQLDFAQFQLRQEVRLAFFRALAASELQNVAQQNVTTLEDHLKQVDNQKKGGVATSYDLLRVQVQLSEARADAIDAEDNVIIARKKLTQLMGQEVDQRNLMGQLPVPETQKVKDLKWEATVKDRKDLQAMNYQAQAAAKEHDAASTWLVPSIYLGGQYGFYESQIVDSSVHNTGNYKNAYNVGVYMRWNLFDGGVSLAKAKEAAFRQVESERAVQSAQLQVPTDFEYWKRRFLSNSDHYTSKKFDIDRSKESVRLAKEEQRAGTRTSTETLDAELDLFRARAGVVNALLNSAEAKIRLEQALGREI